MISSLRSITAGILHSPLYGFHTDGVLLLLVGILAVATYYIARAVLKVVMTVVEKTPTQWDDDLFTLRLMKGVSQLAPAITLAALLPSLFPVEGTTIKWIRILTLFYVLWTSVRILLIFTGNVYTALAMREEYKLYAVKGIFQTFKLVFIFIGIIIALSMLIGKSPIAILTAMGASAAILMLVFKDTIMGLVAGIQLSVNHMLHRGDWIISSSHKANGEVEEVSLTAVKVRNWDNTVTTIPPYHLISSGFQNCEPMRISGGRRVARAIYIDVNTVRFLTQTQLARLTEQNFISADMISQAEHEVNLRLLRSYLERYLDNHPGVNHEMLCMIRELDPTPNGLPLQLYFFSADVDWKKFETLQAEIFDHVYAVINKFSLRVFQTPAGTDIQSLDYKKS